MVDDTSVRVAERVAITVPADPAYFSTLRSCATGIATRCDLAITTIEDLRLAVTEACGLLLGAVEDPTEIAVQFSIGEADLEFRAEILGPHLSVSGALDPAALGWVILQALVCDLQTSVEPTQCAISFSMPRAGLGSGGSR